MTILDKVKKALRVKSGVFDDEIQGLIDAAMADLRLVGIKFEDVQQPAEGEESTAGDPLIERAIILYAKANFGFSEEAERFQKTYERQKCALSLAGDYIAGE